MKQILLKRTRYVHFLRPVNVISGELHFILLIRLVRTGQAALELKHLLRLTKVPEIVDLGELVLVDRI